MPVAQPRILFGGRGSKSRRQSLTFYLKIDTEAPVKILASSFRAGGGCPLRPHFGCATALCLPETKERTGIPEHSRKDAELGSHSDKLNNKMNGGFCCDAQRVKCIEHYAGYDKFDVVCFPVCWNIRRLAATHWLCSIRRALQTVGMIIFPPAWKFYSYCAMLVLGRFWHAMVEVQYVHALLLWCSSSNHINHKRNQRSCLS